MEERVPAVCYNGPPATTGETLSFSITLYYGRSTSRNKQEACNGGLYGKPEGCVMCEQMAGAAGTPRVPRPVLQVAGVFVPGPISRQPKWDTTRIRIDYGRVRTEYEWDTVNCLTAPFGYVCGH